MTRGIRLICILTEDFSEVFFLDVMLNKKSIDSVLHHFGPRVYIARTPPFIKGGLEFPKIDWKGGFKNFCRKGVESWKGGVDLEKGGLIDFPLNFIEI